MTETNTIDGQVKYLTYSPLPQRELTNTDILILNALKEEWRLKIAPTFGWNSDIMEIAKSNPNFAKAIAQSRITEEPVFASIQTRFGNFRLPDGYFEFRVSHNIRVDQKGKLLNTDNPKVNFNIYPVNAEWSMNAEHKPEMKRIVITPLSEESVLKYGQKTLDGELKKQLVLNGRFEGPVDPRTLEPVSVERISRLLYDMNIELSGSKEKTEEANREFNSLLVLSCSRYNPNNIFGVNLNTRFRQICAIAPENMSEETIMELTMGYPYQDQKGYVYFFDNQSASLIEGPSYEQLMKERFDVAAKESMAKAESEAKNKAKNATQAPRQS